MIENRYAYFLSLTKSPEAAGHLTLAEVIAAQQKTPVDRKASLTIKQAAKQSGIPESTLYKLVEAGQLPHS